MPRLPLPTPTTQILSRLEESGHETYVVGGYVRDYFLDREAGDVDLATTASIEQIEALFGDAVRYRSPTMRRYGTAIVDGCEITSIPVTCSRMSRASRIENDLRRRDFTINAIAVRPRTGVVVDPTDGRRDLLHKTIRPPGLPSEHFRMDPLRILRTYRFAATLGFTISPGLRRACRDYADALAPAEGRRVWNEIHAVVSRTQSGRGRIVRWLDQMRADGILRFVLPELNRCAGVDQPPEHHRHDVLGHIAHATDVADPGRPTLRTALLLHDIGKPQTRSVEQDRIRFLKHEVVGAELAARRLRALGTPKREQEQITELVRHHMAMANFRRFKPKTFRRLARKMNHCTVPMLVWMRYWDKLGCGIPERTISPEERDIMLRVARDALHATPSPPHA